MSFQPVVPLSGLAGWRFLQRTMDTQSEAHAASPMIARDTDYFLEKIGSIDTAEQLVSDRRLLRVALGAFGLQDDINNTYFVRKILEDGTLKEGALSNRLSDSRYRAFSSAFGFGDYPVPSTKISDFGSKMVDKFRRQEFEVAIGAQDNSMRLALNADRELAAMAGGSSSDTTKWLRIMGTPPLRQVFEGALGLPASFGQIDLDQQIDVFRERMQRMTGDSSVEQFTNPEKREELVQSFLLRSQFAGISNAAAGSAAVGLMQNVVQFGESLRASRMPAGAFRIL